MVMEDIGGGLFGQRISTVLSGAIRQSGLARATVTVGTAVITLPVPAAPSTPSGTWRYLKVINTTDSTTVTVAVNESPSDSGADPPSAVQWGVGYSVTGKGSELIPLLGTLTTIRIKASAVGVAVELNLIA